MTTTDITGTSVLPAAFQVVRILVPGFGSAIFPLGAGGWPVSEVVGDEQSEASDGCDLDMRRIKAVGSTVPHREHVRQLGAARLVIMNATIKDKQSMRINQSINQSIALDCPKRKQCNRSKPNWP